MAILLDIDGVLLRANSWKKPEFLEDGFPAFNPISVKAFQRVLSETGESVLLTTSHKLKYSAEQWRNIFTARGINPKSVDSLKTNSLHINRKDEILDWYTTKHVPGEEFVIIDDDKILNDLPADIKANLVLTSPSVGLTDELAEEAISILKKRINIYKPAV
jgi:HAD domain in Swiss Army Knife RNA repair proteins